MICWIVRNRVLKTKCYWFCIAFELFGIVDYERMSGMQQQNRRLWQLRATLEEDEDCKKPGVAVKQDSASSATASTSTAATATDAAATTVAPPPSASSTDQSPGE